jgi:uncharacterized protein with NRDE domain
MLFAEITDLALWATLAFMAVCYFGEKLFAAGKLKQILNYLTENQKKQIKSQARTQKCIRFLARTVRHNQQWLEDHDREIAELKKNRPSE